MRKNKSFVVLAVAVCLIFGYGLGLLLYPTVSNFWNEKRSEKLINDYIANVSEAKGEDYSAEFKAAEEYNKTLEAERDSRRVSRSSPKKRTKRICRFFSQSSNGVSGLYKDTQDSVACRHIAPPPPKKRLLGVRVSGICVGFSSAVGGRGTHWRAPRTASASAALTDLDLLSETGHLCA